MSIYTLGIDIGSTASKCVILADGKEIISKSLIAVGAGTSGPQRAISQVLENAGMKEEDMAFTLATGYGRNSLEGNTGVVKALEEELGRTIHTSPLTQYNGALGAALFAYDRYKRAHKD